LVAASNATKVSGGHLDDDVAGDALY